MQANGSVGGTRPTCHKTDARATGELALGFGHEGRAPFLPVGDETDAFGVGVKAVEHGQITFARHSKSVGHALGDQAFNEQVASGFVCHGRYCAVAWASGRAPPDPHRRHH